jgi:indole-3-glycerol phosphate synthase
MNFLARMASASDARMRAARGERSEADLLAACDRAPAPPSLKLGIFEVIAEIKRRSPKEGPLGEDDDVAARASGYAAAGAAAVSVLTEPTHFGGSLEDLGAAACALHARGVPAMRKDFLVDPWQVLEARAAGAGGVLLIVAMLDDALLADMLATAQELGLFVLLETFDEADLGRAGRLLPGPTGGPPLLVGINSRDLRSLEVDPGRLARLAPHLPAEVPCVAESGLNTAADAAAAAALGYHVALVGTALMRAADPGALVDGMRAAGRRAAREAAG